MSRLQISWFTVGTGDDGALPYGCLYTQWWHSAPQSDCTSMSSKPPVALKADITTTATVVLAHHKHRLGWCINWGLLGVCALSSQWALDRDMKYVESLKVEARSALLGESKALKKRNREVDGWESLMITHNKLIFFTQNEFFFQRWEHWLQFFYCLCFRSIYQSIWVATYFFYLSLETHLKSSNKEGNDFLFAQSSVGFFITWTVSSFFEVDLFSRSCYANAHAVNLDVCNKTVF